MFCRVRLRVANGVGWVARWPGFGAGGGLMPRFLWVYLMRALKLTNHMVAPSIVYGIATVEDAIVSFRLAIR